MTRVSGAWLEGEAAQLVCKLLEGAGHQAWFVGGCVRNALMGAPVSDLDISTDARPEAVMALADAAGLRAIPTGIDHGTVTVIVAGIPFEITTFRRDVETDGRRAVVAFADRMEDDAQRRDFTVNALYADRSGEVRDPVGGLPDLAERRFRFIGDAEARIREDYLRILRYFRFFAWYGKELDAEGLAACAALGEGLASLSAERVTAELLKLLSAPGPAPAVAAMEQAGLLSRVLPGASSRGLGPYVHLEPSLDPIARLAALGGDTALLKLSRDEARRLRAYGEMKGWERVSLMGYRHGADMGRRGAALRAAALERELVPKELDAVARGADAVFPVRAADLPMELEGPEIGKALNRLETAFIASDFTLSKSELLALL